MFKGKIYCFSIYVAVIFSLWGFASAQTPEPTSEPTPEPTPVSNSANKEDSKPEDPTPTESQSTEKITETEEHLINIGDLIDIDIVGSTEYDWRGKLTPEGFLSGINFIEEPIYARCRTEANVAQQIAKGYGKILKNPLVVVKIIDRSGRPISMLYGAVKTPQRFQIQRPIHLNELLILSGGITEKASGEIQILRMPNLSCQAQKSAAEEQAGKKGEQPEKFITAKQEDESQYINVKISDLLKGEPSNNPLIFSGDVITVLEAKQIYIIGGVANPRQISARSQITLSRAIYAAGGFTKDANQKSIVIFRREKNETKTIEVDFEKINAAQDKDPELQALDIVEVNRSKQEKRKLPPILSSIGGADIEKNTNMPLRVID
jgi:protein involved in polysaccharide export with SLBB domain